MREMEKIYTYFNANLSHVRELAENKRISCDVALFPTAVMQQKLKRPKTRG